MKKDPISDLYQTVKSEAFAEISVKNSRFMAFVRLVEDLPDFEKFLRSLKRKYHDATHHCSAYITGYGSDRTERFNDDGEPAGTAGRPILAALNGKKITNAGCVVVRYFGGKKLGTGGLARAYGEAAKAVLEKAGVVTRTLTANIRLDFPYELTGAVERYIGEYASRVIQRDFGETPGITCAIPLSRTDDFIEVFRDITGDKGTAIKL